MLRVDGWFWLSVKIESLVDLSELGGGVLLETPCKGHTTHSLDKIVSIQVYLRERFITSRLWYNTTIITLEDERRNRKVEVGR